MVTVVTLRADPECVRRGGGGSPLLQALDVNVLRETGDRMYSLRLMAEYAKKTHTYGAFTQARLDQPTEFLIWAVETYPTRRIRGGAVCNILITRLHA